MHLFLSFFVPLLLLISMGSVDCCAVPPSDQQQLNRFKKSVMRALNTTDSDIAAVPEGTLAEWNALLPTIDMTIPSPLGPHETYLVAETEVDYLSSDEHLFHISPQYAEDRHLLDAHVYFYVKPASELRIITVHVHAANADTERSFHVASKQIHVPLKKMKRFRVRVNPALVRKWASLPSHSIILSVLSYDEDGNLVDPIVGIKTVGKPLVLALDVASPTRRRRGAELSTKMCVPGERNQECCIMSRHVVFSEIGLRDIVSPPSVQIRWCSGTCHMDSSFSELFPNVTKRILLDEGKRGGGCCHVVASDHVDVVFVQSDLSVRNHRIYDVAATECMCT